jgi:aspartate aminotransferase
MVGIGTETAFEAAARARALEATGRDVIHLEIGEPDFDTPANIRAAAKQALDDGWTHYGPALGLPALREAIAADATARKGFAVDPANVVVTPGAKPIMFIALLSLVEPGDEVIYPDPGFPIYESMTRYAGGTPVPIGLRMENDFRMDPAEIREKVTDRTKLIIFNSPHNPTGAVLSEDDIGPSPTSRASATSPSWPTRSTAASSTRVSTTRSPRCPTCPSGRSCSTASARPTP